jgi:hypothetical protein
LNYAASEVSKRALISISIKFAQVNLGFRVCGADAATPAVFGNIQHHAPGHFGLTANQQRQEPRQECSTHTTSLSERTCFQHLCERPNGTSSRNLWPDVFALSCKSLQSLCCCLHAYYLYLQLLCSLLKQQFEEAAFQINRQSFMGRSFQWTRCFMPGNPQQF